MTLAGVCNAKKKKSKESEKSSKVWEIKHAVAAN